MIKNLLSKNRKFFEFSALNILGDAIILFFPILIAKFLSPDIYGSYSLSMMIIFFATTLFLASSQTPFIISANKEYKKKKAINESFTNQFLFFTISLGFVGLIFLIFHSYISTFVGISSDILFFLYLAYLGIATKSLISNYFLGISEKFRSSFFGVIYGALLILFLFIFPLEIKYIFLNYFISSILILIFASPKIKFRIIFPLKFNKKSFAEHWDFSKWQMFGLTAVYFINWGDSIIIRYFLTIADVGIYNLSYQIFKGVISLLYIVNTFYLPDLSRNINNKKFIRKYLGETRTQLFSLGVIITIFTIYISPYFFKWFFESEYYSTIIIFQVLMIGVIFKFWSIFYTPLFNVLKKYKFHQSMNILQIIINIILGIIGIIFWGVIGVAIATTVSYFIRTIIDEIFYQIKVKKLI